MRTNLIKAKIDKTQDSKYRMCGKIDETINHRERSKMGLREYKRSRQDWVGRRILWGRRRKPRIHASEKWFTHEPEGVVDNVTCKVIWDFTIQTGHVKGARRPDFISIKKENNCIIVDFTIPFDTRIEQKEKEKDDKYKGVKRKLQKLQDMKVEVIPIVIGVSGTPPKDISRRVQEIGIETRIEEMQKSSILQGS